MIERLSLLYAHFVLARCAEDAKDKGLATRQITSDQPI